MESAIKQLKPLSLAGIENARTYGAIETDTHAWLRPNLIIRSGSLAHAQSIALQTLQKMHVTAIADLRLAAERKAAPDLAVAGALHLDAPLASDQITATAMTADSLYAYLRAHHDAFDQMVSGYTAIVADPTQQHSLALFLNTAATTDGAIDLHCEWGKDRTGVAAAVLLAALGVDNAFIEADYLASNAGNTAHLAALDHEFEQMGASVAVRGEVRALSIADVLYLRAAMHWILAHFDSVASYVANGLGVNVDALRIKFLTMAPEEGVSDAG